MIIPKKISKMQRFVGRRSERNRLTLLGKSEDPSILSVYGKKRVGKTELLEQVYADRNILKFEGIEGKSQKEQQIHILWQLSEYTQNPLIKNLRVDSWVELFKLIYDTVPDGHFTIYFEELQWLAEYSTAFVSELKFAWDNYFCHRKGWLIILCGSSPSFMVNQVLLSKSLYNRSQHEMHLKGFQLTEAAQFLSSRSHREVMDAYLTVGGVPEYLKWCKTLSSIRTSIFKNSFTEDSFFSREYERIFVSSLSENKHYKAIIEFLSGVRFASRNEILKSLKITSTGSLSSLLKDLELSGFIEKYAPYNLEKSSHLVRYCISDYYLQFYYKFIKPIASFIQKGMYEKTYTTAIRIDTYQKWLGYAFERFCRYNHHLIAKILGFHGIHYQAGAFFNKRTSDIDPGFQFDLIFDRSDRVITICEIKYLQSKVGIGVIDEFERKLELFHYDQKKSIQKVLIASEGASQALIDRYYFDHIITLEDLFTRDAY